MRHGSVEKMRSNKSTHRGGESGRKAKMRARRRADGGKKQPSRRGRRSKSCMSRGRGEEEVRQKVEGGGLRGGEERRAKID